MTIFENRAPAEAHGRFRELLPSLTQIAVLYNPENVSKPVLLYDLAPALVHKGVDMYKKELAEWFATFQGAVGFEVHDLSITAGDGVAFAASLNHITGKRTNGEPTDVWVRATIGFAKKDGGWKATHEHFSVPFYMDGSYKAAVDLKP
jgi:ketosteroid isomerase-like protein